MASKLYVTEFSTPPLSLNASQTSVVAQPPLVDQTPISVTASSAQSSAFSNSTVLVRLANDGGGAINILFGTNPTATVNSAHMAANQTEYFWVGLDSGFKVAAIASAA